MSYMFGITRRDEASNPSIVDHLDRLAKQVDSRLDFIACKPPGSDIRGWFEGPNLGFPRDRDMELEVRSAVVEAGLGWIWAP